METIEFLDSTYVVDHVDGLVSRWFPTEQSRVRSKSKLPQGQVFKIKALCVLNTEEFGELVDGGWVLLSRENKTSIFAKEIDKQIVKETDAEEKLLQTIATWNRSYLSAKTEVKAQEKDNLNRNTEVIKSQFIQQSHSDNKLLVSDKFEDEKDVCFDQASVLKYEEPLFVIEPTDGRVSHNTLTQSLSASDNENQTEQINQAPFTASSPLKDSIDAQENHTPEKGVWDTHNESIGESCDSDDDNFFMPDRSKSMTPSSGPANCGCVTSDSSSNYVEEEKKNRETEGKLSSRTNDNFDTKRSVDDIPSRTSNNGSKVKQEILKLNSSKNSAPLSPTPITSSKHPSSQTSNVSPIRPAQVSFASTPSVSTPSSRIPSYQPSSFKSKNPRSHSKKMKSTTLDPTQRHQILFGMPPPPSSARPSPPASITSTHSSVLEGDPAKSPFSSKIKSFHTLNRTSGLIGTSGSNIKNGDLDNPGGIVLHKDVDDRMVLFVVNGKKHRIDVFDADSGDFIRVIGGGQGSGLNQLYFPTDIVFETISSETYMYVSDSWNHRIQVYNADTGEFARTLCMDKDEMTNAPILQFPTGLALLPKDEEDDYFDFSSLLYVADSMNHRILVVRTDTGEQFLTIGNGRGKAEGKLNGPQGLLIYKTQLFVADSNNNRVQVFNAINGSFVRSIGSNASLRKPIGLTIFPKNATASGKDFLVVSDFEKDAVVIYDIPSGSIVDPNTISRKGRGLPDDICHSPRFMTTAVSPDNEYLLLFVSEGLLRNRIQVIQL